MDEQRQQRDAIVVLGMHRSGTSLVANLFAALGYWPGPDRQMMPANRYNAKGYWERLDVASINDSILRELGGDWMWAPTLAENGVPPLELQSYAHGINDIVTTFEEHSAWVA